MVDPYCLGSSASIYGSSGNVSAGLKCFRTVSLHRLRRGHDDIKFIRSGVADVIRLMTERKTRLTIRSSPFFRRQLERSGQIGRRISWEYIYACAATKAKGVTSMYTKLKSASLLPRRVHRGAVVLMVIQEKKPQLLPLLPRRDAHIRRRAGRR